MISNKGKVNWSVYILKPRLINIDQFFILAMRLLRLCQFETMLHHITKSFFREGTI